MTTIIVSEKTLERMLGKLGEEQILTLFPRAKANVDAITGGNVTIEVTGDRPDLLSAAGVARAVKGMRGDARGLPPIKVHEGNIEITVDPSVSTVRPFVAVAYIELSKPMAEAELVECMQLQEKLHITHGRKRRKVAIGVHDASRIAPPLIYKAVDPDSVAFIPLASTDKMTLRSILNQHEKGKEYAFTLSGQHRYPLITDSKGSVVSFPPIINGAHTALKPGSQKILVEVTGTDFDACNTALNIICQDFSDIGAKITGVKVKYPDRTVVTPITEPEQMTIGAAEVSKALGLPLNAKQIVEALERCRLGAHAEGDFVKVSLPRYRADFLHPIDVIEDVALGIGFDNFTPLAPKSFTMGSRSPRTQLVNTAAEAMVGLGLLEASNYVLTSHDKLLKAKNADASIEIKNPVSAEYAVMRPALLPGLLDVLSRNKHADYPQRLFEVGEVVVRDDSRESRTRTELRAAVVCAHANASITEAASILHELLKAAGGHDRYRLEPSHEHAFLHGRQGIIHLDKEDRGIVGEIHPEVLEGLGLAMPVCAFEFTLLRE